MQKEKGRGGCRSLGGKGRGGGEGGGGKVTNGAGSKREEEGEGEESDRRFHRSSLFFFPLCFCVSRMHLHIKRATKNTFFFYFF